MIQLEKIYKKQNKFDNIDDNFDYKLLIFYDKCKRIDVSKLMYDKAILVMLKNETQTHYYVNRINYVSFDVFCVDMKLFFEEFE